LLPEPTTDEEFYAIDPEIDYAPALRAIAERAGLGEVTPLRFDDGSLPVFAMGEEVVKLYPPCSRHSFENEARVLAHVEDAIGLPTPRLKQKGEVEAWGYVVMSRLEGEPIRARFDDIPPVERRRLARELGQAIARLRALSPSPLPHEDWAQRIAGQRAGCVKRHERLGLTSPWLERIEPFLDEWLPRLSLEPLHVLHTEIMREHVFVKRDGDQWQLSGLLDFEPSCVGPAEYELASVGLFFSEGDSALWTSFLEGLGVTPDEALAHRCLAWGLLHRYANLSWWLGRDEPKSARRSLSDLAIEWFA